MKSIVMPVCEHLNEENAVHPDENRKFTKAKESNPENVNEKNSKPFTVQEMWRHRRQARSASDRLRRWNLN